MGVVTKGSGRQSKGGDRTRCVIVKGVYVVVIDCSEGWWTVRGKLDHQKVRKTTLSSIIGNEFILAYTLRSYTPGVFTSTRPNSFTPRLR